VPLFAVALLAVRGAIGLLLRAPAPSSPAA